MTFVFIAILGAALACQFWMLMDISERLGQLEDLGNQVDELAGVIETVFGELEREMAEPVIHLPSRLQ